MADIPDTIVLKRHRDLSRAASLWWRRVGLLLLTAFALAGLANVFGQRPSTIRGTSPAATFSVYVTHAVRGGDFLEARFHITAHEDVKNAVVRLDPGWLEGMSLNTVEPTPIGQASDDGRLVLTLGHIPRGTSYILFLQFQVNPTNVAWHRRANAELDDGPKQLVVLHHTITVFP